MARKKKSDTKVVKIAQLGSATQEVLVDAEATVEDCLEAAEISTEVEKVTCDGDEVEMDDIPENGDYLVIASDVKGASL